MRVAAKVLVTFLLCNSSFASPVLYTFRIWEWAKTDIEKTALFWGWTNGFLQARGHGATALADCLEQKMTTDQAIAMITKYYNGHPEKWSSPFGDQILEALTVEGGPCEGKNPLR